MPSGTAVVLKAVDLNDHDLGSCMCKCRDTHAGARTRTGAACFTHLCVPGHRSRDLEGGRFEEGRKQHSATEGRRTSGFQMKGNYRKFLIKIFMLTGKQERRQEMKIIKGGNRKRNLS